MYRNSCSLCAKLGNLVEKMEDNDESMTDENKVNIKNKVEPLREHTCLKFFDGCSKGMESDSIVHLVVNAPEEMEAYIRDIIMDDDKNTRDNLQEDNNPSTSGCLENVLPV